MFRMIGLLTVVAGLFVAGEAWGQVKVKFKTPEAQLAYEQRQAEKSFQKKMERAAFINGRYRISPEQAQQAERERAVQAELMKEAYRAQAADASARQSQAMAAQAAAQAVASQAAQQADSGVIRYRDDMGNRVTEFPSGMRRVEGPVSTVTEYPNGMRDERTNFGGQLMNRDVPQQRVDVRFQPYYPRYAPLGR